MRKTTLLLLASTTLAVLLSCTTAVLMAAQGIAQTATEQVTLVGAGDIANCHTATTTRPQPSCSVAH